MESAPAVRKTPWPIPPWCAYDFPDGEAAEARLVWLAQPWWKRPYLHAYTWIQCFHIRRLVAPKGFDTYLLLSYRCRSVRVPLSTLVAVVSVGAMFVFLLLFVIILHWITNET